MNRVNAYLSLGGLADWLARVVRWSPVGREIVLKQAEGPNADRFNNLHGRVVAFEEGILLVEPTGHELAGRSTIRLAPRHVGWTGRSLMLCRIAVLAETAALDGSRAQAIAVLELARHRGGS